MNDKEESEQYWKHTIQKFLNSGLSRPEFCQKYGISSQQMLYWMGKHFESTSNLIPAKIIDKPVHVAHPLCELELSGGHKVKILDKQVLGTEFTQLLQQLNRPVVNNSSQTSTVSHAVTV